MLAFLVLSLVVITLDFRSGGDGPLETAKDISTTIVAPIQRGVTTVFRPVGNFFSSLGDLSSLRADNTALRPSGGTPTPSGGIPGGERTYRARTKPPAMPASSPSPSAPSTK